MRRLHDRPVARRAPLILAVVAASVVSVVGCAGDESPSGAPSPTSAAPTSPATTPPTTEPAPPQTLPWGPTLLEWEQAARDVAALSLPDRAAQVIVAGYGGTGPPRTLITDLHVGGVIVLKDNVASIDGVRVSNQALAADWAALGRGYPLLVGVDQEGGRVARLGAPVTEFPTFMTYGAARDDAVTQAAAHASGTELRALGFTAVFAPDADVTIGPADTTIGSRSASADPTLVAKAVTAALRGYSVAGIVPVVKHFPGHGSVTGDSHVVLPPQQASLDALSARDLVPFDAAVAAGAPAVMTAHLDVQAVDPGVPSTLSPAVIALLRQRGFEGVVVSDALNMGAVTRHAAASEAAVRALAAGVDLLLLPPDPRAARDAIVTAVQEGRLAAARLDEAATRVVALMRHHAATAPAPDPASIGVHSDASYAASLAAMSVVSGPCSGALVGPAVSVRGGDVTDRERFSAAARAAGLAVGSGETGTTPRRAHRVRVRRHCGCARRAVRAGHLSRRDRTHRTLWTLAGRVPSTHGRPAWSGAGARPTAGRRARRRARRLPLSSTTPISGVPRPGSA